MTREEEAKQTVIELRKGNRRRWLRHATAALVFTTALICGGVGFIYKGSGIAGSSLWFLFLVIGVLGAALMVYRSGGADAAILSKPMDAGAIGALIERMDISFGAERRAVIRVLVRLLDHVQAGDGSRITKADRVRLDDALRVPDFQKNAELLSAIIRAYERIGNHQSLDLVQTLALQTGDMGRERHVRDAARSALPGLAARIAKIREGEHLLRASTPTKPPEELLRASVITAEPPADELLRATAPQSDEADTLDN